MSSMEALAEQVIEVASSLGARIAVAESLTGGLVHAALVAVPNASLVMMGGIVTYHTELKHTLLGVDDDLLEAEGPVHPEVARQMAEGVRRSCAITVDGEITPTDFGVATTGVAGPEPDPQTGQEPGTVWLGIAGPRGTEAIRLDIAGNRTQIRESTVQEALHHLLLNLSQDSAGLIW